MKGAAQRWITASITAFSLMIGGTMGSAVEVTDNDRTFRNFTREAATVGDHQVRLEVRGLELQGENTPHLNTFGILQEEGAVSKVDGGVIDLLGSFGLGKTGELGFDIPGYIETKHLTNGQTLNNSDVGDILLYTKFKHAVAEHCSVGGSFELTLPNGPTHKGFGTDEMSFTPSVSTRYQRGLVALGANVGYQIYTGDQRPVVNGNDFQAVDIFHYGAEVIVRASDTVALRTEVAGRIWSQNGDRWNDSVLLPGIDVNISDALTFRPTGWVGLTSTALDWGIGAGLALQFPMPKLAAAPPPPPSPTPAAETPPPAKEKIILRGVKFDFNKATLRPDALPILDQAAEALKEHGAINVTVEGYTDNIGSEVYNQRLSERRATAVRDYLAAHGVAAARMTVVGRGQADPVASNDTEDGRAQNRRVELRVTE